MNQPLINYIINLEKQGYKEEQIYNYLISNKYIQTNQIANLKREVTKEKENIILNQIQYYYNYYKQQNYSDEQIRNYFLSQNFNINLINKIIPQNHTITHEIGGKTILKIGSIFALIIILSFSGFFIINNFTNNKELLDLQISKIDNYVKANSDLNFQLEIMNMGTKDRYDIIAKYQIKKDNKILKEEMDSFAISTIENPIKSIYIPKTYSDGSYQLYVEIKYSKGIIVKAQKEFLISTEKKTTKLEKNKETITKENNKNGLENKEENKDIKIEDKNANTNNNVNKENKNEQTKPTIKKQDCSKENNPELCYLNLAKKEFNTKYCNHIEEIKIKEKCYTYFIELGKYELCESLEDSSKNPTCTQKKELDNLAKYYENLKEDFKVKYKNIKLNETKIKDIKNKNVNKYLE